MGLLQQVSRFPISFGGASLSGEGGGYGFGAISEAESIDLLHKSFEGGFRIFDTAPIYGFGASEYRIGKAFIAMRDQVFLVSKSGVDWSENKRVDMTNDPQVALRMLGESLDRLQTDYVDLYMVHWPDARFDIRQTLEALQSAKEKGRVRHLGLCNTNLEELERARSVSHIEVVQNEFNYFQQSARELFPYLNEHKISFMSYGTFDKGILTGRVDENRKFDEHDLRGGAKWFKKPNKAEKYERVRELRRELEGKGQSLSSFAVQFNLSFPEVESAIVGIRNKEQLDDILKIVAEIPREDDL